MRIGNCEIEETAALAPMAGVCDAAFRTICRRFGASYVVSEMVSIKGIEYNGRKTLELMRVTDEDHPVGIQLFGHEPAVVAQAAVVAERAGADVLDLNMGCPTPKITGNGGGAALLKNPPLCAEIVRAAVRATSLPVTAKIRIGWDEQSINCVEVAKRLEDAGAAAITVHGRTRAQFYAPSADWSRIAEVKRAVSIPVIGNGDVNTPEDAQRMYDETGCDLVMVGRGAMGRPWLFRQIDAARKGLPVPPDPTAAERVGIMREHMRLLIAYKGAYLAMQQSRGQLSCYVKGLHAAPRLREAACKLTVPEDLEPFYQKILEENA